MRQEVMDSSGAILFKKDEDGQLLDELKKEIESLKKEVTNLKRRVTILEKSQASE